jgi:S1-C subfamily serine protease
MKTLGTICATFLAILPWCFSPLSAQKTSHASGSGKVVTITQRSVEADGTEHIETFIKKGAAAENFNAEQYVQQHRKPGLDIEVQVKDAPQKNTAAAPASPAAPAPPSGGAFGVSPATPSAITTTLAGAADNCAYLGVSQDEDEDPDEAGLKVEVIKGTAAEAAGLQCNDIILSLNKRPVNKWSDLSEIISKARPGDQIAIKYRRDDQEFETDARLTRRNEVPTTEAETKGFLGVSPAYPSAPVQTGQPVNITPKSAAEKAGMKNGARLLRLNDTEINDFEDISDFMNHTRPGQNIKITFEQEGRVQNAAVVLGSEKGWDWTNWNLGNVKLDNINVQVREKPACLGVYTNTGVTENDEAGPQIGAQINEFTENSAARDASMQQGDIITAVNKSSIRNHDDLWNELAKFQPGDKVTVNYLRDNERFTVTATLKGCKDNASEVIMNDTDDAGDNQSRTFYIWNWGAEDDEKVRERRVIPIRKGEGDTPRVSGNLNPQKTLELQNVRIQPGSTKGQVELQFGSAALPTVVSLFDTAGRQLFREELNAFDGNYQQQFDLSDLSGSTILFHIQQQDKVYSEKYTLQ